MSLTSTMTATTVQSSTRTADHVRAQNLSTVLPLSLDQFPKLGLEQAGHLRHFHNLVSQLDGLWKHMGCEDPGQEAFDAYRFQISNMAFAASLTHYHRLPALRGVFKPLIRRLIHKMLRRDVWGYWYNTSSGSNVLDPSLTKLREPWPDPVARENIMYSGHLLLMVSLYTMLFDDDEFERPNSIVFDWDPRWWGLGPRKFHYSISTLQNIILTEMEQNGWVGVCCEPNVVFVVCNQFHLLATRYIDARNDTTVLNEILPKYVAALEAKGMMQNNELIAALWMQKQDVVVKSTDVTLTAWASVFLAAWNSKLVKAQFERQREGYITTVDGQVTLRPATVGNRIRELIRQTPETHRADSAATVSAAMQDARENATQEERFADKTPAYGFTVQWVSEIGRQDLLDGLLSYADQNFKPTWEDGGLFYPRQDVQGFDWTYVDPFTGNTGIAYARLNVPGGQEKMFQDPWTKEQLAQRPYVDNVDLSHGVDFLRGVWDESQSALVMTFRSWDGKQHVIEPRANHLEPGDWGVYVNGRLQRICGCSKDNSTILQSLQVEGEGEVDLVLLRR